MPGQNNETNSSREGEEFLAVVAEGHRELGAADFQSEEWSWTRELDEEGVFLFSYLLHDFRNQKLSLKNFEEAVYTLGMLLHKMLPPASSSGLSRIGEFQVIFNLYEKLKQTHMSWEACEGFVAEQIAQMHDSN